MESVEQNNSKKKLIVPLIALMLCAVAVIGIGYGLTSTSSNSSNSVTGTGLVVNLTDGATEASLGAGEFATGTAISYYTTQTDGTITYTVTGADIGKGTLKITSTDTSKEFATVKASLTLTGCENSDTYKFALSDGSTSTVLSTDGNAVDLANVTLTGGSGSAEYTLTLSAGANTSSQPDVNFTYTIVFSVTV